MAREEGLNPKTMLLVFIVINGLTYFDRGVLSGTLDELHTKTSSFAGYSLGNLTEIENGALGSAYMGGYILASPMFATLVSTFSPLLMMAVGLSVWTVAVASCGLAPTYTLLIIARVFTGVGEASFLVLAPPFIDRSAPKDRRSRWLSFFYMGIPIGMALGFGVQGMMISMGAGWRPLFLISGALMVPWIVLSLHFARQHSPPSQLKDSVYQPLNSAEEEANGSNPESENSMTIESSDEPASASPDLFKPVVVESAEKDLSEWQRFRREFSVLVHNPLYMCLVLGYAMQTFVIGGFAYWGDNYVKDNFNHSSATAGLIFGGLTVVMGFVGTGAGGLMLDWVRKRSGDNEAHSLEIACRLTFVLQLIAWPLATLAFVCASMWGEYAFYPFLALCELLLLSTLTPINAGIMWAVPFRFRPQAMAISVVFMHVLGDGASPVIVGQFLNSSDENWDLSLGLASQWLLLASGFFLATWILARRNLLIKSRLDLNSPRDVYKAPLCHPQSEEEVIVVAHED